MMASVTVRITTGQRDGDCMAHAPLDYWHIVAPDDVEAMATIAKSLLALWHHKR